MALAGTTQALIAAFSFGVLLNAASAGVIFYVKGHGLAVFRDGLRLALIIFLAASALWAQIDFLTTIIDPAATSTCQAALIFSSLFDQIGRVAIEQFLLWAVTKDNKSVFTYTVPQLLVVARFIIGMVFVGETQVQFNPTCVQLSGAVPLSITLIALDAAILAILAICALSTKTEKDARVNTDSRNRSRAVLLTVAGLAFWMGASVTMILGLNSIMLLFRTTIPAVGLSILVVLVIVFSDTLVGTRNQTLITPNSPTPRRPNLTRNLSSTQPNGVPTHFEDVKEFGATTTTVYVEGNNRGANRSGRGEKVLPTISRPVTGVAGIGGLSIQGELFPPRDPLPPVPRVVTQARETTRVREPASKQWRNVFDRGQHGRASNAAGRAGAGLAISAPILREDPEVQDAIKRIPTVDLATAVKNDQERRDRLAERSSSLIASRPAPRPPSGFPHPLRSNQRAVPEAEDPDVIARSTSKKTNDSSGLSVQGNASTSSAQLSPGVDELRRRSPRQPSQPLKSSTFQPITPGQPIRIPIPRPPTQLQSARPKTVTEPVKTPLERRPTIGLPSNPRSQAMQSLSRESALQTSQTVMFINDIVYDDPDTVDNIMQGVARTSKSPLRSSDSVLHRPRPIPRTSNDDRQVFPAEVSPGCGHKRTKSGGSIVSRKSVLMAIAGNPSELPPLPPAPFTSHDGPRPHPNDTKSMTFDEKMTLLYSPSITRSATTRPVQGHLVHDLPPLPEAFQLQAAQAAPGQDIAGLETIESKRQTKTTCTDRSSVRTQSILGAEDDGRTPTARAELGHSWLPGVEGFAIDQDLQGTIDIKRRSSPVLPVERYSQMSDADIGADQRKSRDACSTNWGSIHSPVAPVNVQASRMNARSTYVQKEAQSVGRPPVPPLSKECTDEVVTVMLDTSSEHSINHGSQSSLLLQNETRAPAHLRSGYDHAGKWHRRVGDDCPSFADRSSRTKSRKMPPPTPLLLNGSKKRTVIMAPAEPSPIESPGVAYEQIQAQLDKLERHDRGSLASEGRRLELLENLETEMGLQQSKWQSMHLNLERNSVSTLDTPGTPTEGSGSTPTAISSVSQNAQRRATRRARPSSSASLRSNDDRHSVSSLATSTDSSRASLWRARLAEAQAEYKDNVPQLLTKRVNVNFLSVSKAALGTPTPPDTDESDSGGETLIANIAARLEPARKVAPTLWRPQRPLEARAPGRLWVAPPSRAYNSEREPALPGLSVRPAPRKALDVLKIQSLRLWQRPAPPESPEAVKRLWANGPYDLHVAPPTLKRALTQRPARRPRRVTLLPDILESPKPLPEKRGTLGIFQFPWGEQSDSATYRPQPRITQNFMAMPGTMTTGGPNLQAALSARTAELDEYSSSFFDDYEEEDPNDTDTDFEDLDGSDDEFDESTLWEIASLLQADESTARALVHSAEMVDEPPPEMDYYNEVDKQSDGSSDESSDAYPAPSTPTSIISDVAKSALWVADTTKATNDMSCGISQPSELIWNVLCDMPSEVARSTRNLKDEDVLVIESKGLWTGAENLSCSDPASHKKSLWAAVDKSIQAHRTPKTLKQGHISSGLWTSDKQVTPVHHGYGLPQPNESTWGLYCDQPPNPARPARKIENVGAVEGRSLWSLSAKLPERRSVSPSAPLWISSAKNTVNASLWMPENGRGDGPATLSLGLSQPNMITWGLFCDLPLGAIRPARHIEILPCIESQELWSAAEIQPALHHTSPLWGPTVRPAAVESPEDFHSDAVSNTLQLDQGEEPSVARSVDVSQPTGVVPILNRDLSPSDTRPSRSLEDALVVEDEALWSEMAALREAETTDTLHGNTATSATPSSVSPPITLWNLPSVKTEPEVEGLFNPNANRSQFRTTSQEPVLSPADRRPRRLVGEVGDLSSQALWAADELIPVQIQNVASLWRKAESVVIDTPWSFSQDTARKEPAECRQELSADPVTRLYLEKVVEATLETKSNDLKKAASLKPAASGWLSMFRFQSNSSPREPAAPKRRPEMPHRRGLTEAHWDEALNEAIRASRAVPKYRQRKASPKEWSTALGVAIAASYPQNRLSRGQVPISEWEEELREAIAKSQRSVSDISGQHSVSASAKMATAAKGIHPAAIGHAKTVITSLTMATTRDNIERVAVSDVEQSTELKGSNAFDVSRMHPVFASGSLVAMTDIIHPAALGHSKRLTVSSISGSRKSFDASRKHPVFAASTLVVVHPSARGQARAMTPAHQDEDVSRRHPSALGYVKKITAREGKGDRAERPPAVKAAEKASSVMKPSNIEVKFPAMWSPSKKAAAKPPFAMWESSQVGRPKQQQPDLFEPHVVGRSQNASKASAREAKAAEAPLNMGEQNLWRLSMTNAATVASQKSERHWLHG